MSLRHLLVAPLAVLALAAVSSALPAAEPVDFARQIQPLFAQYCHACHGPDEQLSGLRLDAGALVRQGGDHGPSIVPGKSDESVLMKVLRGEGDIKRMPYQSDPLSDEQIALVARWIDEGAKVPENEVIAPKNVKGRDHWAFQPIRRPLPPAPAFPGARNAIDLFIHAKLQALGMRPSSEADRATLIRRLSLDLVGLPPSPAEVDEFLADSRPDAYERLVDRLLASPHYGERWGRHWLDAARYADSNGFTIDGARSIWKYRDWVIDALNADMPFDEFTIEQLAGDMLPQATLDQVVATGFHRNTLINQEGGTDREQFRVESVVDRVNTTGAVFLGLTLGCAQCHEHKYDPVSQREYYQLFAIFNNCDEPVVPVPTAEQAARESELQNALAAAEQKLREFDERAAQRQAEWEQKLSALPLKIEWANLELNGEFKSEQGATVAKLPDASFLASGNIPTSDTYTATFEVPIKGATALRLEALTHESLPGGGPGLAANGNFILTDFSVERRTLAEPEKPIAVPVARAYADHAQSGYPIAHAIDDDPASSGWAINVPAGKLNVNRAAVFILGQPLGENDTRVTITLRHGQKNHYNLGRWRVSMTTAPPEVLELPEDVRAILATRADQRSDAQKQVLATELRKADPERKPLQDAVNAARKELEAHRNTFATTMVMRELQRPRQTHIHIRGDFLRRGAPVSPGVPAVLDFSARESAAPGAPMNRLDFARWLCAPEHPLTARVTVNRVWQHYFGKGIVETENDFGTQGAPPAHPELLDYLATELIRQGWRLKELHRLIVTSATYRQTSRATPEQLRQDAFNKWLGRQTRMRVEAEAIRDIALSAAGLLTRRLGGPSVFPPQPEGIYRFTQNQKNWVPSQGADRFRRGLYTYFWRSSPDPFLMTFDAPPANVTCTRRVRSDTPLQSLTLANDKAFVEIFQGFAERIVRECNSPDANARLEFAFRLAVARTPAANEVQTLRALFENQRMHFEANPEAARQVAPASLAHGAISAAEAAAWTMVARTILNLDETITRE